MSLVLMNSPKGLKELEENIFLNNIQEYDLVCEETFLDENSTKN
jgi:hypothetical protein